MSDSFLLGLSQRIPPSNTGAEQVLLGALMANNKACRHVEAFLRPGHFADPVHGQIYDAIMQRWLKGCLVDAISLRAVFQDTGALDEVGGVNYLAQLTAATVGIINASEYGRAIHDAWTRRELVDIGEEIVNRAFGADAEMDGGQQVVEAFRRIMKLSSEPAVFLEDPELRHLRDFHQALASRLAGLVPKPIGAIEYHDQRATMLNDMLPPDGTALSDAVDGLRGSASPFTEAEMVDGVAVDMREPAGRAET